jgi:hypothetical protein
MRSLAAVAHPQRSTMRRVTSRLRPIACTDAAARAGVPRAVPAPNRPRRRFSLATVPRYSGRRPGGDPS